MVRNNEMDHCKQKKNDYIYLYEYSNIRHFVFTGHERHLAYCGWMQK